MWVEIEKFCPKPQITRNGVKQGYIICTSCGCSMTTWMVPGYQKWGCRNCGSPSGDGVPENRFNPNRSIMGWDHLVTMEKLISSDRLERCSCNGCKGQVYVLAQGQEGV